jgi:uncharacterized protein (TIGR00369 family)
MTEILHKSALKHMFDHAPINRFLQGLDLHWDGNSAVASAKVREDFLHAGGTLHGALYMKLLDDAAYFTAALENTSHFILTADFQIRFLRPVQQGIIQARGCLIGVDGKYISASSRLFDAEGQMLATGEGRFAPGPKDWASVEMYTAGLPD